MKSLVVFFLSVVTAMPVFSQQKTMLSLDAAVEMALKQNVRVIQARNNLEAAQFGTQAAVGSLLPSVDASASFSRQQNWRDDPTGTVFYNGIPIQSGGNSFQASNSFGAGISSRLTLFDGFANTSNLSRAQANAIGTEFTLNRAEQNAIYQTYQLYLNVVRTYQLMGVSDDNLKRSKRQLDRISESNKVGAVALADVYRQQVQVGNDELASIQAETNFKNAITDLTAFLGADFATEEYSVDMTVLPKDIDITEFATVNATYANFDKLVKGAVEKRPDYQASIENLNESDASVRIARAGHYPTVSASASYGYNNSEFNRLRDNRNLSFNLNVSLPIFSGFSTQNQIEQAEVFRNNAEEDLRQAQRQIAVDIRKALLDLESAEKQVTVTQTSVQSAEMDRKIAEEKYNLGAGTLLDLLVAHANYTGALSNKVNAVVNYLLAKKGAEFALGIISQ